MPFQDRYLPSHTLLELVVSFGMCVCVFSWNKQFRDEQTYYRLRHTNPPESLEVEMDDLESKAGEFGIYDLSGFYQSKLFKEKR